MEKIKIGISSCLLGNPVRYDGGHKLDHFLRDTLGQYVDYLPVCPEAECGMGIPREAMRLEGKTDAPHLVTRLTREDKTDMMVRWAKKRVVQLAEEDLCGFIFKSDSPSSGMERVKVYDDKGIPAKTGVGIFARIFMEYFPLLPVEEEGRLRDAALRENFIERIFTLKRWREIRNMKSSRGVLVDFHARHKLLLLSHSTKLYQAMGTLVAGQKSLRVQDLFSQYEVMLMDALKLKTTPKKNVNVLQHMMGYFKEQLSADEKKELLEIIDNYQKGLLPLIVPVTLIGHYVRKYDQPYLREQIYLNPHPLELQLRNHV
ncbi:MAG: YbgA family protein [Smithellaceae bacterium]